MALRSRIKLFESVVGRLQPILSSLPRTITETVLRGGRATEEVRAMLASDVRSRVDAMEADRSGLDLDVLTDDALEMPARPAPTLDLAMLDAVIRREDARPPGIVVREMSKGEYAYIAPGMDAEVRVTTDARYFEEHAETVELWSPGSPLFPLWMSYATSDQDQGDWPLDRLV